MIHAFTVSYLVFLEGGFMAEAYFHRQLTPFCRKTFLYIPVPATSLLPPGRTKIHPDKFRQTVISQSFQDFSLFPGIIPKFQGVYMVLWHQGSHLTPEHQDHFQHPLSCTTQLGCQVVFLLHTDICCSIPSTRPQDLCRPT